MKIKIIIGFRKEQAHSVDADEAHKAYYLFLHPEKRGVFSTGLALLGSDIRGIEPDYNGTMGWNPSYQLGDDDWNEIRRNGIEKKLRDLLCEAKEVAQLGNEKFINLPLSKIDDRKLLK